MNAVEVLAVFDHLNVIRRNGHYAYTSNGRHGSVYVNKDALYPHSREISQLCLQLAHWVVSHDIDTDCIVGPEKGGIILAQWVGYHISSMLVCDVTSVFAEKCPSGFVFTRGYAELVKDKHVLIVEDVINSGRTVAQLVDLVRETGGIVEGVVALCNRSNVSSQDIGSLPQFFALLDMPFESWSTEECPMCRQGIPIDRQFGKGKIIA